MFNSLPIGSPLYVYLNNNCKWLLVPLKGHTNIDKNSVTKLISLLENNSIKASTYSGVSGCYIIARTPLLRQNVDGEKNNNFYIGSTTDLNTRYKIHKTNSTRVSHNKSLLTPLYSTIRKIGWKNFFFKPIIITTNHFTEFFKTNLDIISVEHQYILRSFTQFEARIYEQALISYYHPNLNNSNIVVFPFMN